MSMGDSLSDAHAKLIHDYEYYEAHEHLPKELRVQVLKALAILSNARKAVDHFEVTGKVKA